MNKLNCLIIKFYWSLFPASIKNLEFELRLIFFLDMGQEVGRAGDTASKTLALQHDADGKLRHDALARVGHGKEKVCSIF